MGHRGHLLGTLLACGSVSIAGGQCYEIEWFAPPSCAFGISPVVHAHGLNEGGTVVGDWGDCDTSNSHPFIYSRGVFTSLPLASAVSGELMAVNSLGIPVGAAVVPAVIGTQRPALFSPAPSLLSVPLGTITGYAYAVNDVMDIVGFRTNTMTEPSYAATLWRKGQLVDIAIDLGGPKSESTDVTESGQVVGWTGSSSIFSATDTRGFVWQDGKVTLIPPVPAENGFGNSAVFATNEEGTLLVQGTAWADGIVFRTFLWRAGAYQYMLEWPTGWEQSRGNSINDHDEVAGSIQNGTSIRAAVLRGRTMRDLNEMLAPNAPIGFLNRASAINNSGQIAGWGRNPQNKPAGFLLTPRFVAGDLTSDCRVNGQDLAVLLAAWGPPPGRVSPADFNHDEVVNGLDLAMLLAWWKP